MTFYEDELYTTSDTENAYTEYTGEVGDFIHEFIEQANENLNFDQSSLYDEAFKYPLMWDCFENRVDPEDCAGRALKWIDFTFGNYTA